MTGDTGVVLGIVAKDSPSSRLRLVSALAAAGAAAALAGAALAGAALASAEMRSDLRSVGRALAIARLLRETFAARK